uniref:Uncharacterized protein n=1 Tax=Stomoxys calcitrans TaxID=35570 RepID=A0A1I8Q5A5_STOCA
MELVLNFSAKMLFDDFCLKIYFWPFLTYLANIKGICPLYPGPVSPTVPIPTYQPTPPTPTPLVPCPAMPLVCLPNGARPIPYCPCIDPRQQMGVAGQAITNQALVNQPQSAQLQLPTNEGQQQQQQQQYALSQQQQFAMPTTMMGQSLLPQQSLNNPSVIRQPLNTPEAVRPLPNQSTTDQLLANQQTTHQANMTPANTLPQATSNQTPADQPMTGEQLAILQQQMAQLDKPMTTEELVELLDQHSLEFKMAAASQNQGASEMMIFSHLPDNQQGNKKRKRRHPKEH